MWINARRWRITQLRLTRDPFWLNIRLARGHWFYRVSHAFVFGALSQLARSRLVALNLRHTQRVFGLLQNARVDESYTRDLVAQLPPGDSELYSHPSLDEGRIEFEALVSPDVKAAVVSRDIRLIRYQDL